jgi:hypothetical protein
MIEIYTPEAIVRAGDTKKVSALPIMLDLALKLPELRNEIAIEMLQRALVPAGIRLKKVLRDYGVEGLVYYTQEAQATFQRIYPTPEHRFRRLDPQLSMSFDHITNMSEAEVMELESSTSLRFTLVQYAGNIVSALDISSMEQMPFICGLQHLATVRRLIKPSPSLFKGDKEDLGLNRFYRLAPWVWENIGDISNSAHQIDDSDLGGRDYNLSGLF